MAALPLVLFFLSGFSALAGEIVWMRMLGLVLGNTVWAASAVVAVWMGGMAFGAWLGGRLAPRVRRHLRWYGLAEAVIGIFYALSPVLLPVLLAAGARLGPDLGDHLAAGIALRFLLAAVALAVPTVLMGLTLPLLVERLRGRSLTVNVGALYGLNTLGAVAGVLTVTYLLLPRLGEAGALAAAAMVCGLVAVTAVGIEGHLPLNEMPSGELPAKDDDGGQSRRPFLLLTGLMGFVALAAELVWVRVLVLHLGSRVYAFAVLLAVYLLGLALGSLAVRAWGRRIRQPRRVLATVELGLAAVLVLQVVALGFADRALLLLPSLFRLDNSFASLQLVLFFGVFILFAPPTLLFGAAFPLAAAADPGRRPDGEHAGAIAAANTAGGILGAMAAPFLLVPLLGSQRTILLLALCSLAIAAGLVHRLLRRAVPWGILAGVLAVWFLLPPAWILERAEVGGNAEILELHEGIASTAMVLRYHDARGSWRSLEVNGINVAGDSPSLLAVQQMQGQIPLLLTNSPRTVLHIGFGSGGTCHAVSLHPVEHIDIVEISPEVLRTSGRVFHNINHGVLRDPRVHVIVNDGRNYLLATQKRYDVILSDSIHPVYSGNGALYTEEYFELCRRHLNPGGIVSMWLPLYSLDQESYLRILSAFHHVFPRTAVWHDLSTVNEFTVVTGQVAPGPLQVRWSRLDDPALQPSLATAGITTPFQLAADLLLGPAAVATWTAKVPPHVDDLPWVEYRAGRVLDRNKSWFDNLVMLVVMRQRSNPFARLPIPWTEVLQRREPGLKHQERAVRQRARASR